MYHQQHYIHPMHRSKGNEEKAKDEAPALKPLNWTKPLRKHKGNAKVFIWGKAIPRNMFPQNQDQLTPFKPDQLSSKKIWDVAAAREGQHCFGIGKKDWCFVWGETKHSGALGLGNNSCSTPPFLIKTLMKQRVRQACCSAVHSLCITDKMIIYGWGSKLLTLLKKDTDSPTPLDYLLGKGLNRLSAANTHSLAWKQRSNDVYSFGTAGPWLGCGDDDHQKQTFGKIPVPFGVSSADCSSQYSLFVSTNGSVGSCGINEHGRMGVGKATHCSSKIVWNAYLRDIVLCSAGAFHSGYVDCYGNVHTVGVRMDCRLGDGADGDSYGEEKVIWIPQQIVACDALDICQIECVAARTYVITTDGDLIMFGKEPVTGRVHKKPFIYHYLRNCRVYKVCGAKDFCVALVVERKQPHCNQPDIDNTAVDSMQPDQTVDDTNRLIGTTLEQYHPKCIDQGYNMKHVYGNFASMEQMQYDVKSMQQYAPPIDATYGGLSTNVSPPPPPPPSLFQKPNQRTVHVNGGNNNNNHNNYHYYGNYQLPYPEKF